LLALLTGAKAGGTLGVLFAVPVTVVLVTVLQEAQIEGSRAEIESRKDIHLSELSKLDRRE